MKAADGNLPGQYLTTGSNVGTAIIWDLNLKKTAITIRHTRVVCCVEFSPDSTTLATSGTFDKTIKTWKTGSENAVAILSGSLAGELESAYVNFVFSADGKYLVAGVSDGTIRVWDYRSKQIVKSFKGHNGMIYCIAHS